MTNILENLLNNLLLAKNDDGIHLDEYLFNESRPKLHETLIKFGLEIKNEVPNQLPS